MLHVEEYYVLLGVTPSATAAEIKRAFRKKVKQLHPDIPQNAITAQTREKNESKIRKLLHAYETLINPRLRSQVDAAYAYRKKDSVDTGFNYRLWLLSKNDMESRVKLIFFDLFHALESEAVHEYLRLRSSPSGFLLSQWCSFDEFMDCGFVLAEELYARKEYYEAFLLLEHIIYCETMRPYFKHFFPEVLILTRSLLNSRAFISIGEERALECYESALGFGFESWMQKMLRKKIEKIYIKQGRVAGHVYKRTAL